MVNIFFWNQRLGRRITASPGFVDPEWSYWSLYYKKSAYIISNLWIYENVVFFKLKTVHDFRRFISIDLKKSPSILVGKKILVTRAYQKSNSICLLNLKWDSSFLFTHFHSTRKFYLSMCTTCLLHCHTLFLSEILYPVIFVLKSEAGDTYRNGASCKSV